MSTIANIFSPNNDGKNDVFEYSKDGITIQNAVIYDRWGNQVHEYDGHAFWDGKMNGQNVSSEVYTYLLNYTIEGVDKLYKKYGDVTVIR